MPFTGCLGLGKVVLQLRALCVSLCGSDPVFIALFRGNLTAARITYFFSDESMVMYVVKSEKDPSAKKRYLFVCEGGLTSLQWS